MQIVFSASEVVTYYQSRVPKLKRVGKELRGPCPVHAGRRPSFAVNPQTGEWMCHSECNRGGSLIQLEMKLSNLRIREARDSVFQIIGRALPAQPKRKVTGTYTYENENGQPQYRVLRIESSQGKTFVQEHRNGDGNWVKGLGGVQRVPYRLPEIMKAQCVVVVEGEQKAELLRAWNYVGTCNSGGSGKWLPEFSGYFKNREVVILPDNDDAGRRHALAVAENLLPVAKSLRILELPGLPQKGDICDWQALGGTREKLEALISEASPLDSNRLAEWEKRLLPNQPAEPAKGAARAIATQFHVTDEAVYYSDPKGDDEPTRICSRLDVLAQTRNDQSECWGRLLKWLDGGGREHLWAMPMSLLAGSGDEYRARLLDGGLQIYPGKQVRERLTIYIQTAVCEQRVRCVGKLGWHGETFVFPDSSVGASTAGEKLVFQSPLETQNFFNLSGSLGEWTEKVGRLCSGNSRLIFAVSCAFAAPLLSVSKEDSGGFHFYGPSSTGKTTALLVAGSVWGGGGRNGFVESWRTTINGLEAFGELHNDALACLDEISQGDAREVTECLYLLANGLGKARMAKTLSLRNRLSWTTLILSSGEITLAEHSETAGKRTRAGAEIRLANLPVDAGKQMGIFEDLHIFESGEALSRHLRDASKAFYGQPMRHFLKHVVGNRPGIEDRIRSFRTTFLSGVLPPASSGEVTRAAGRFALAGVAGELATELGITGWQPGEARNAAARCLEDWLLERGTLGAADIEAGIRQVRQFIGAHGNSRFQAAQPRRISGEPVTEHIPNRAGFKREDEEGNIEYLVLPDIFRSEVCRGFDVRTVARALADRGYLCTDKERLQVKRRLPDFGSIWVYGIRSSIMDAC
jgi:putative DNA primase/helicase